MTYRSSKIHLANSTSNSACLSPSTVGFGSWDGGLDARLGWWGFNSGLGLRGDWRWDFRRRATRPRAVRCRSRCCGGPFPRCWTSVRAPNSGKDSHRSSRCVCRDGRERLSRNAGRGPGPGRRRRRGGSSNRNGFQVVVWCPRFLAVFHHEPPSVVVLLD
jgi:hypothetical protein